MTLAASPSPVPPPHALDRRALLAAGAGALALPRAGAEDQDAPPRRSCLFLIADQHRWDVAGFAGDSHAHTPHLDRLAREGTSLDALYCQVPLCVPARQSLLTGLRARDHGTFGNVLDFPAEQPDLAAHLGRHGWRTAMFGKSHFADAGFETVVDKAAMYRAFKRQHEDAHHAGDHYVNDEERPFHRLVRWGNPELVGPGPGAVHHMEDDVVRATREWIAGLGEDEPFFAWASFTQPHPPRFPPQEWIERFAEAEVPLRGAGNPDAEEQLVGFQRATRRRLGLTDLNEATWRGLVRAYYASVAYTDHCVGQLLEALERAGRLDDTLVVYTSDHGELLGQHGLLGKFSFFEGALRVPGIVRLPGAVAARRRVEQVTEHLDLMRTTVELMGAPRLPGSAGASLSADLAPTGSEEAGRAEREGVAISEMYVREKNYVDVPGPELSLCIRRGPWKYLRYAESGGVSERLFQVVEDPGEETDRCADRAAAGALEELRDRAGERLSGSFHVRAVKQAPRRRDR